MHDITELLQHTCTCTGLLCNSKYACTRLHVYLNVHVLHQCTCARLLDYNSKYTFTCTSTLYDYMYLKVHVHVLHVPQYTNLSANSKHMYRATSKYMNMYMYYL